jgi:hypothetical protein
VTCDGHRGFRLEQVLGHEDYRQARRYYEVRPTGMLECPENRTGVSGPRDLELSLSFSRPQEPSPPSGGLGA